MPAGCKHRPSSVIERSAARRLGYNPGVMNALAHIPRPSAKRIAIHVKPAAERALRRGHPWLFEGSIRRQSHAGQPGDLAVVFDARDRFLAIGLYDPDSPIRVRVLHHGRPTKIDADWFRSKLAAAFEIRSALLDTATTGYRLLHGENDGLPGLVVDRYDDSAVMRLDTAVWLPYLPMVVPAVLEQIPFRRLILRVSRNLQRSPATLQGLTDGYLLHGAPVYAPILFHENGLRFEADLAHGQKTGFFLDQRENRSLLESLIDFDSGLRQMLNVFAYSGAFGVYAARGGADYLMNIDISESALNSAERNLQLNKENWAAPSITHEMVRGDAFMLMSTLAQDGRLFDVVVIDPPSFARKREEVDQALRAYTRLVQLGLSLLRPHGLMVMSSCSSRVDAKTFFDLVNRSARQIGRPLEEISRTENPVDHPVSFPEGAYLKCLFARAP